jgi:hypothetical protein
MRRLFVKDRQQAGVRCVSMSEVSIGGIINENDYAIERFEVGSAFRFQDGLRVASRR